MLKVIALLGALLFASPALAQSIQLGAGQVLGNSTAGQRPGAASSVTSILDRALGSTRGAIIERSASGWGIAAPGTAGLPWVSAGAGADPAYGVVGLAGGGCNAALTASNGGILYSTASACAILAGTATARQMLQSGAAAAPAWSTATWPATTTINQLLYSSSANVVAGLATANGSILNTDSGGVPALTPTPVLGVAGTTIGSLGFRNATSGTVTLQPVTGALGTINVLIPAAAGTMAVGATSPLALNASTGMLTCTGCLTNTPAALTKVDDTNVTVTLGGTPSTALLQSVSFTFGWNGQLAGTRGGTGVSNSGTITVGGNLSTSAALAITAGSAGQVATWTSGTALAGSNVASLLTAGTGISITGTTNATIGLTSAVTTINGTGCTIGSSCTVTAAAGTLTGSTLAAGVTGSSLTSVGTISTGVWQGTNVSLAKGGTNASLTANNGGIVYSNASALAILASTVTAGQCLLSGSSAAPTWGSCAGAAAVSSVADSGAGTLTFSPTTGSVLGSINLANANIWTGKQTFGSGAPDTGIIPATTGTIVNAFDGTSGSRQTSVNPSVYIYRRESITGALNGYTSALTVGATGVGVTGGHQTQAIQGTAVKDATSTYDVVGVYGTGDHYGSNGTSFGGFFSAATHVVGSTTLNAITIETATANGSGSYLPYSPTPGAVPAMQGLDVSYGGSVGGSAGADGGVAMQIRGDFDTPIRRWDVGIGFMTGGIRTADIQSNTSSTHILYAAAGSHTNGINLAAASFSGNAFSSPGVAISGGTGGGNLVTDTGMALSDGTRTGFFRPSSVVTGFAIGTATNHDLVFAPNSTVAFRLAPGGIATILGSGASPTLQFSNGTTQSLIFDDSTSFVIASDNTLSKGVYMSHGTAAWLSFSDERAAYKKSAREVRDLPSLDDFHIYENETTSGHRETFVKAQELYRLFPNFVKAGDNDPNYEPTGISDQRGWGVSYDRTGIVALAYVKKQDAAIHALKADNDNLRACQASWKCRIFGIR